MHVEVSGLEPDRWYWYRYLRGDAVSPIARTRTAPRADALGTWNFAFASCQQYEQGYYAAHRHMADEDLDLAVFLGDYIYESSWGHKHVRTHEAWEPFTLAQYRNRYARYKSDRDLQRCHAAFPWIVTWDDHEVFWTDGWDGYPAARRRLLTSLMEQKTANPIVIGGDIHANVVADLKLDFDEPRAPTVAAEFCGTSITSEGARQSYYDNRRARNPHVKLARSDKRGYTTTHLSPDRARAHLRAIHDEKDPHSAIGTSARFIVANGTAGAAPD